MIHPLHHDCEYTLFCIIFFIKLCTSSRNLWSLFFTFFPNSGLLRHLPQVPSGRRRGPPRPAEEPAPGRAGAHLRQGVAHRKLVGRHSRRRRIDRHHRDYKSSRTRLLGSACFTSIFRWVENVTAHRANRTDCLSDLWPIICLMTRAQVPDKHLTVAQNKIRTHNRSSKSYRRLR